MPKPTPEPRVYTSDVGDLLKRYIRPGQDEGESVAIIAEQAGTSSRTVYRILAGDTDTIGLDLADRLLVAVGESVVFCRVRERAQKI